MTASRPPVPRPFRMMRWPMILWLIIALAALWLGAAAQAQAPATEPTTSPAAAYDAADAPSADGPSADAPSTAPTSGAPGGIAGYERLAEDYDAGGALIGRTQSSVDAFREKLIGVLKAAPTLWTEITRTLAAASPTGQADYFVMVALITTLGLLLGYSVEKYIYRHRIVGPWFIAQQKPSPWGYVEKLPILALRVFLTGIGVMVACITAIIFGSFFYEPHSATLKTGIVIIGTYALIRMVEATWRMIVSPKLPNYRIPALSDADAKSLFAWLSWGAGFGIASVSFSVWMESLGMARPAHAFMTSVLSMTTVLITLSMIRANQRAITSAITGGSDLAKASVITRTVAKLWAPAAVLYFIFAWAEMTYRLIAEAPLGVPLIGGAYFVLMATLIVYATVSYSIEWAFSRRRMIAALNAEADAVAAAEQRAARLAAAGAQAGGPHHDGGEAGEEGGAGPATPPPARPMAGYRMRTMEDLARRVASVLAVIAGAWSLLWTWDAAQPMEEGWSKAVLDIAVVGFIGYVLFHMVRIGIDQRLEEEGAFDTAPEPGDEGGGAAASSRLATLLPLFRNFLLITIAVITGLMVLLESGLNVTPIFAGAGVLGLAIGFGAQTLVRDIFSGVFFLVDDAFRKGEYIDLGFVKGTVEKISIRSFQLRHHLGYLHTIPFGEVQFLTNFSRDWVIMKLPLRLTYDTDVERVRKLIKNLGKELQADPLIGDKFLQPLKSQGVYEMEDSAMILRVKFMTKPGEQWVIRKRIYAEIRELFEREGVRFAHREVTVHVADKPDRPLSEPEKTAIAGAVRPILDPAEGPAMAVGDER